MATSEGLKQRSVDKSTTTTPSINKTEKTIKAKQGLRSLAVAIIVPVILSATSACLTGTTHVTSSYKSVPPILAFHFGNIVISAITSLSAWLIWAKGGFHRQPRDIALFFGQFVLGLLWGPLMFRAKEKKVALAVAIGMGICLFGCCGSFRRVNKVAGDILVPCIAWAFFLAIMSYKSF